MMSTVATKKIGLIGGLALRAGIFYYEQILQRYAAQGQRLQLVLAHADVNTVLAFVAANDSPALGRYLGSIANDLFDAGVDFVAVTAVAPHLAVGEIVKVARGPIFSVLDVIADRVSAAGQQQRLAVFGNRAVMETNVYGALPKHVVVTLDQSLIDTVHNTYTEIALNGKRATQHETEILEAAARTAKEQGADVILLAGTDLSSFYAETKPAYPFLDVAEMHIDRILAEARLHAFEAGIAISTSNIDAN